MYNQGIYKISIGPKIYFGQSVDLLARYRRHLADLKNNRHNNSYMQNCFNKYLDYKFDIVELVVDITMLDEREQHYIDLHFDHPDCMNLAPTASTTKGYKHTEETKERMRERHASVKDTEAYRIRCSKARAKQVQVTYPNGNFEIFQSATIAALRFGIHTSTVTYYCTGKKPQPGTGLIQKKTAHIHGCIFKYVENIITSA